MFTAKPAYRWSAVAVMAKSNDFAGGRSKAPHKFLLDVFRKLRNIHYTRKNMNKRLLLTAAWDQP
jgi:hypothetical protein